jgi:hypothetical protein
MMFGVVSYLASNGRVTLGSKRLSVGPSTYQRDLGSQVYAGSWRTSS